MSSTPQQQGHEYGQRNASASVDTSAEDGESTPLDIDKWRRGQNGHSLSPTRSADVSDNGKMAMHPVDGELLALRPCDLAPVPFGLTF